MKAVINRIKKINENLKIKLKKQRDIFKNKIKSKKQVYSKL
jgi:hypothetical protein